MKSRTIDVLFFDLKVALYSDATEYNNTIQKNGYISNAGDDCDGCEVFLDKTAYIYIKPEQPKTLKELVYILSVIIHESSHVADDIFEFVNEDEVGGETRAYLIERIAKCLIELYLDIRGADLKTPLVSENIGGLEFELPPLFENIGAPNEK